MIKFEDISFLYWLGAIPVFFVLFYFMILQRKARLKKLGDLNLVKRLMPEQPRQKLWWKFSLYTFIYILIISGLANPQIGSKLENVERKGVDLIIALDVSNSMLAEDIKPNRLERAKRAISKLVDQLQGDRIHTVPGILRRVAFSFKDVAQMSIAVGAEDFHPTPVGILLVAHRSGNFVIKAGPSAARIELIIRLIEFGIALAAQIGALVFVVFVFPGAGALGPLVQDDKLFGLVQLVVFQLVVGFHLGLLGVIGLGQSKDQADQARHQDH